MNETEDVRVENLLALIAESSLSEVSRRSGRSPSQLSYTSKRKRPFGEKMARGMEEAMGFPRGWFDQHHNADESPLDQFAPSNNQPGGVPYLPAGIGCLFPVPTLILQGGEREMRDVKVFLDSNVFEENFKGRNISDFSAAIALDKTMSPEIKPNDRVLIDTSNPRFTTNGVYCLQTPSGLILRYVNATITGKHLVSAIDSPDGEQVLEDLDGVSIIGRVELVWNARKI